MKKLIITIDTEGDNLWSWKPGDIIRTENTLYLERFQKLANAYGFKPVWLSNYEMISDTRYVDFITKAIEDDMAELGMHLHSWSTPPDYELPIEKNGAPFLIEFPYEIMEEKIHAMTEMIIRRTGVRPVSHRSGRWTLDDRYLELLHKYGYKIDCSVTPHIDWSMTDGQTNGSQGSDYSNLSEQPYYIFKNIIEVPMSIRQCHRAFIPENITPRNLMAELYHAFKGKKAWFRPNGSNRKELLWLLNKVKKEDSEYIMFMIHSSELMPGGSPTFKTKDSIEKLYTDLEIVFKIASMSYEGATLKEMFTKK